MTTATPPPVSPEDWHAVSRRLTDGLRYVDAGMRPGAPIRLGAFDLRAVTPSTGFPAQGAGGFRWTARRARRALSLPAVRACLTHDALHPAVAVAAEERRLKARALAGAPAGSLARWLARCDAPTRAVARAEATCWATHLWQALDWRALGTVPAVGEPDQWWDWPGSSANAPLALRGRADLRWHLERSAPGDAQAPATAVALFSLLGGLPRPTSDVELGLAALVGGLLQPDAPPAMRVGGLWPSCGRAVVLDVDLTLLHAVVDAVLGATARASQRA